MPAQPRIQDLIDLAIEREPLDDAVSPGYSGAKLERLRLRDGSSVILKHISPVADLAMRVTADPGRSALLHTQGVYARFPAGVDPVVIAAEPAGDGWLLAMRDVSQWLIPEERRLSRSESRRILAAAASLHAAFRGADLPVLCSLATHLTCLSPAIMKPLADLPGLPSHILAGWQRFDAAVPASIRDAVYAVHRHPEGLAAEMSRAGTTLIHGDLWLANIGLSHDGVIFIDFGLAAQAPGDLDFALFLLGNWWQLEAMREELIDDWRAAVGPACDERSLRLSLFAAFCEYGWLTAGDAANSDREAADLAWWLRAAEGALELWSPT